MRLVPTISAFWTIASSSLAGPEPWINVWPDTDFGNTCVESWVEILSGGPTKDGICALSDPEFRNVADEDRLTWREPVITVEIEGTIPRAHSFRYLTWHEIVNDIVGGIPVPVTFCPLCNSGITFDRRTDEGTQTFGVSGKQRHSDMTMFDRETESWWQQAIGEAIIGELNGTELISLPSWLESWDVFEARNPDGL